MCINLFDSIYYFQHCITSVCYIPYYSLIIVQAVHGLQAGLPALLQRVQPPVSHGLLQVRVSIYHIYSMYNLLCTISIQYLYNLYTGTTDSTSR